MLKLILVILLALCALVLTYRAAWVLEKVFRVQSPSDGQILRVKLAALGLGVLLFAAVMLWF